MNHAHGHTRLEEHVATATRQLDKLMPAENRNTLRIKAAVRTGEPYQEIIEHAEEAQVDLVVMAVRGRGALDLAVFGSQPIVLCSWGRAMFSPSMFETLSYVNTDDKNYCY